MALDTFSPVRQEHVVMLEKPTESVGVTSSLGRPGTDAILAPGQPELVELATIRRDFDRLAPGYVKLHRSWLYDDAILGAVPAGSRILEVGCGGGELTRKLCSIASEVTAVDLSPRMLEIAVRHCAGYPVVFRESSGQNVSAQNLCGPVDVVVAKFLLHDYADPVGHLRDWLTLLSDGGRIIVLDRYREASLAGRAMATLGLYRWMWERFDALSLSIPARLRLLCEDAVEWYSLDWIRHRRHEKIRTLADSRRLFDELGLPCKFGVINSRSFLAVVEP